MFGLERATLYPIAGTWTFGAMLVTILHSIFRVGWLPAFVIAAAPAAAVTVACLLLIQGKPAGYFMDWIDENLLMLRDEERPRRAKLQHPLGYAPHERP